MSEWNTFEFMDRAATVELLIAELLTDHPVGEHPALEAKLTALEEAAGALYQAAGTHHHTLTPAKPEQVITKRHGPVETVMVTAAEQPTTTADVPVVDAVWVECTLGKGADAATCLAPYGNEKSARDCNSTDFHCGKARIVRLRSDGVDEQARANVAHAHERLHEAWKRIAVLETHLAATVKRLEERVATAEAGAKFAVSGYNKAHALDFDVGELKNRVAKLEAATTPATVRVVAPVAPQFANPLHIGPWSIADTDWRAALSAAGVEVKEAST
jgi:hypothetical protein